MVLTIFWIRVVASLLLKAESKGRHFSLVVLEGRSYTSGAKAAKVYADSSIPTTVILDSVVGCLMERADMVVVGSERVVDNRGIVNNMGTYAMGVAVRYLGNPFYVAANSYNFARLFPLNQSDLTDMGPEAGLSFMDTEIWEVTGVVVGTRPLLCDWILLF